MAYTLPTAETIKTRFPEFSTVDDTIIGLLIGEAALWVDTSWMESDYTLAITYLTAHYLSLFLRAQMSSGGGGGSTGDIATFVDTIKFEDYTVTMSQDSRQRSQQASTPAASGSLTGTQYGILFTALRNRNVLPIALIGDSSGYLS